MLIYGLHTCRSAIESGKNIIKKIYIQKNKKLPDWLEDKSELSKKIIFIEIFEIQKLLKNDLIVHQGILMEVELNDQNKDISDLRSAPQNCTVAILDNVTDPHNLGAIIRSAAAFGVRAIILLEKSSCKINATVAKTASGGLEYVDIYTVKNINNAIEDLKNFGFWIVSFCERGEKTLAEIDLKGKTCLIFGAEGSGIRRLPKENSDFIVKLPTDSKFATLNVSASAAVAFYEVAKQNNFKY